MYGSTDACLIETVIDFVTLYHKEFPGGIIWLNACNEELLETQCKQQKVLLLIYYYYYHVTITLLSHDYYSLLPVLDI